MGMMRPRTVAVEYNEAEAFVELVRRLKLAKALTKGWNGDGSVAPLGITIRSAERFAKDRQSMATRLHETILDDGRILYDIAPGDMAAGQGPATVIIDRDGKPELQVAGKPDASYPSVSDKKFRKALDDAVRPRSTRYGKINKPEVDGIKFDSPAEAKRYVDLKQQERFGQVSEIRLQVAYPFVENDQLCFTYYADFVYVVVATGEEVVEDVKGMMTDVYRLKKKLIDARYGIRIQEYPPTKAELARREREARNAKKAEERAERDRLRAERKAERLAEDEARARRRAERGTGGNKASA